MDFGHRFQVSRIHLFGHDSVFAHGLYLPEAGHCIRMGLQKFRLFSQTVRRHDIIGRKRTEILAASMFQQFIQRRDNALVFTMNKAELEFFGKLFQDFGRAILATIVKSPPARKPSRKRFRSSSVQTCSLRSIPFKPPHQNVKHHKIDEIFKRVRSHRAVKFNELDSYKSACGQQQF